MRQKTMRPTTVKIYEYIREHIEREGFAPSLPMIAKACGMSPSGVYYNLGVLEDAGLITREPRRMNGIKLTDKALR